jgi:hypothetical protein
MYFHSISGIGFSCSSSLGGRFAGGTLLWVFKNGTPIAPRGTLRDSFLMDNKLFF